MRYDAWTLPPGRRYDIFDEPWTIDFPAAEQNLSRRLKTVTSIQVHDPVVITIEDPNLWNYPWIYIVEPGNLRLKEAEVSILREFLLRGGTLTFDDFHGTIEWVNLEREMKRVFPDRKIIDLPPDHPIFHCFYDFSSYPQTPGLGSFLQGRTWEKGGYTARLRAIEDDAGRAMVLINWNTDMGDGWEWSNASEYPWIREVHGAGVSNADQRDHLFIDALISCSLSGSSRWKLEAGSWKLIHEPNVRA